MFSWGNRSFLLEYDRLICKQTTANKADADEMTSSIYIVDEMIEYIFCAVAVPGFQHWQVKNCIVNQFYNN